MSNTTSQRARALAAILVGAVAALSTSPARTASTVLCEGHWKRVANDGPPGRDNAGIAYDSARKRVVLFGGSDQNTGVRLNDTWEWDGEQWIFAADTGPSGRAWHSLAYDSELQRVVLFGGQVAGNTDVNDTWTWDGTAWQEQLDPNKRPSPRNGYGIAYDNLHRKLVLYGGNRTFQPQAKDDTWTTDVPDWKRRLHASGPGGRFVYHGMAFDREHGLTIQYSGDCDHQDTWAWDGKAWAEIPGAKTATPHWRPGLAYDSARHRIVLYGGLACSGGPPTDTWEWDGTAWQQVATDGPGERLGPTSVAYDRARGEVVMFGSSKPGHPQMHDTWTWNGPTYRCDVPIPGDINCDGIVDKDDVKVVDAARGHPACAADDTRDVDGDGRIDFADKAMVQSLCTFAGCKRQETVADDDEAED
jgi:hypothetical protein